MPSILLERFQLFEYIMKNNWTSILHSLCGCTYNWIPSCVHISIVIKTFGCMRPYMDHILSKYTRIIKIMNMEKDCRFY